MCVFKRSLYPLVVGGHQAPFSVKQHCNRILHCNILLRRQKQTDKQTTEQTNENLAKRTQNMFRLRKNDRKTIFAYGKKEPQKHTTSAFGKQERSPIVFPPAAKTNAAPKYEGAASHTLTAAHAWCAKRNSRKKGAASAPPHAQTKYNPAGKECRGRFLFLLSLLRCAAGLSTDQVNPHSRKRLYYGLSPCSTVQCGVDLHFRGSYGATR